MVTSVSSGVSVVVLKDENLSVRLSVALCEMVWIFFASQIQFCFCIGRVSFTVCLAFIAMTRKKWPRESRGKKRERQRERVWRKE